VWWYSCARRAASGGEEAVVRGLHLLRRDDRLLQMLSCTYGGLMRMHAVTVATAGDAATMQETASWQVRYGVEPPRHPLLNKRILW
jgi:hypothetical protein